MRSTFIAAGLFLALGIHAMAQPAATIPSEKTTSPTSGTTGPVIQVQLEYIEVSHESLTELLFLAAPKTTDASNLRKQVQELVLRKEAKVLETQIVACKSGQKATNESINEYIYPTEYDTPELACGPPDPDQKGLESFPVPTAFDTRNVGGTLEVEPVISTDGKIIDLKIIPDFIWRNENTIWHETKDSLGNICKIQMPNFYTVRMNTSISCVGGQYVLLGVLTPRDAKGDPDPDRKLVLFVKTDVLSVK